MGEAARETLERFLREATGRRLVVACPGDAAGLAAAELARRWAGDRIGSAPVIITPGKGELLIGARLAARARMAGAEALLALDLGADAEAILPGVPTLFIDHHRHQANLPAPVIEPAAEDEARPAGVALYEIVGGGGEAGALEWLAQIAAESGHPKAALPAPEEAAAERPGKSALREVSVLLNAAGRSSRPPLEAALALLGRSAGAEEFLADESPEQEALADARAEVMRELGRWSHTRPRFMWRVALVPVASACRIEPILAAMWQRQLERYMVVAANSGYVPGLVTVVARTASKERNLLRLLDAITPPELPEPIALGCRDYVEAVIPRNAWKAMLGRMRFRQVEKLVPPPGEATLF